MSQLELRLPPEFLAREQVDNARLRCIEVGNRLRVICVSKCRNPKWFVSFPQNLRKLGIDYRALRIIAMRQHYRAISPIVPVLEKQAIDIGNSFYGQAV